jgi:hypothetical protein
LVATRRALFVASLAASFALACAAGVRALPPPEEPRVRASSTPTATPLAGTTLPFGSTLEFVLDDKVNSGTIVPGTTVHMHLRAPLVVNGVTLAPAGSPATFAVINARKAHSGDEDGALQIHLDPLALPGRNMSLPIRAYHEYLTVEHTAGQLSTLEASDTVADIFIPGHYIYHAFRSGRQMVLPVGSVLRAETDATIDASQPSHIVFSTPPPFTSNYDVPHADLTAPPFYTPAPMRPRPLPKGKATLPPTPSPSPSPTPSASSSPEANAAPPESPSASASATPATK